MHLVSMQPQVAKFDVHLQQTAEIETKPIVEELCAVADGRHSRLQLGWRSFKVDGHIVPDPSM